MLDDSQAALLQNGNRKKQSTSYKRPGPPTPSKNAGRLSIGGNEINYNNILKESKNSDNITKNTPSRIKSFFLGKGHSEVSSKTFYVHITLFVDCCSVKDSLGFWPLFHNIALGLVGTIHFETSQ